MSLHPIMQAALAPHMQNIPVPKFNKTYCSQCGGQFGPGDHGYSDCRQHTKHWKSHKTFTRSIPVEVYCEIDYEPGCRGSWSHGQQNEPDYTPSATLTSACIGETDILDELTPMQIEAIEQAYLREREDE